MMSNDRSDLDLNTPTKLYERMLLIRRAEERLAKVCQEGALPGGVHLYIGQEAIAVGVCSNLEPRDWITSTHRGHGHFLAKGGDITPLTQKVILRIWGTPGVPSGGWRAAGRGRCNDRNAVSNNEGVIADQNVLDDESHDSLPFHDIERVGRVSQSCQKSGESLRQAQEHGAVVGLVGDCSGLLAQRLFPLAQRGHSLAKLLK